VPVVRAHGRWPWSVAVVGGRGRWPWSVPVARLGLGLGRRRVPNRV